MFASSSKELVTATSHFCLAECGKVISVLTCSSLSLIVLCMTLLSPGSPSHVLLSSQIYSRMLSIPIIPGISKSSGKFAIIVDYTLTLWPQCL